MPDFLHTLKNISQVLKNLETRTDMVIDNLSRHDGVTRGIYRLNGDIEILKQNKDAIPHLEECVNRLYDIHTKGGPT